MQLQVLLSHKENGLIDFSLDLPRNQDNLKHGSERGNYPSH